MLKLCWHNRRRPTFEYLKQRLYATKMPSHADALFLLPVYRFCKRVLYIAGYNTQYYAEAYLYLLLLVGTVETECAQAPYGKCMNAVITYLLRSNFTIVIRA